MWSKCECGKSLKHLILWNGGSTLEWRCCRSSQHALRRLRWWSNRGRQGAGDGLCLRRSRRRRRLPAARLGRGGAGREHEDRDQFEEGLCHLALYLLPEGVTGIRFEERWDLFTRYLFTGKLNQTRFSGISCHRNQVTLQNCEPNTSSYTKMTRA